MDIIKKIEELEKKIKDLESLKKDNYNIFGRSYSLSGNTNSDYLIKTKGQIKLQVGNTFIDLIKDGKINVDSKFLFSVKTFLDIGTKEGVYFVESDGSVWIKFNEEPIQIVGNEGNSYVSYNAVLNTTSEQKYTALLNLGVILDSVQSINGTELQNGFIYVQDEQLIYTVSNGVLSKLTSDFPNPLKVLLIIDLGGKGSSALKIKGTGVRNGIELGDGSYIFDDKGITLKNISKIKFVLGANKVISEFSVSQFKVYIPTICNTIQSDTYTLNTGFKLYYENGKAILHIDKVIERYPDIDNNTFYIFYKKELIKGLLSYIIDGFENFEEEEKEIWSNVYEVAVNPETFLPSDKIVLISGETRIEGSIIKLPDDYPEFEPSFDTLSVLIKFDLEIDGIENGTLYLLERVDIIESLDESEDKKIPHKAIIINENSLYISGSTSNYTDILLCIGDLKNLKVKDNTLEEPEIEIEGSGIYSTQAIFDTAAYTSSYSLLENDNSSRLASTEWVRNYVEKNVIKAGYYWSDNSIPENPKYIGVTDDGFSVSKELPYLWYTNDGKEWILKNKYIVPNADRIYIGCSAINYYRNSLTGKSESYPAGFFCYIKNGESVTAGFGLDNYISITPESELLIQEPKLAIILDLAEPELIPHIEGYIYIWSIDKNADKSLYANWKSEAAFGSDSSINRTFHNLDFGNASYIPGYTVFITDDNGKIIGNPTEDQFIIGNGTIENWKNPKWIKSFLKLILKDFLLENSHRYNPILGWNFNYGGVINCFGYGGHWSGRLGALKAPDEQSQYSKATLYTLTGTVIGFDYKIDFEFSDVTLGMNIPTLGIGLGSYQIGSIVNIQRPFYEVDYEKCSILFSKLDIL